MFGIKKIKVPFLIGIAATGFVLVATGCQTDGSAEKDFFPSDCDSPVNKIADAQAAAGSQDEATIYPTHFDGNALNSLGRAKLDLITQTLPDEGPVTIYILSAPGNEPKSELNATRTDAVKQYLLNSHLAEEQFKLVAGPNVNLKNSSGGALANYGKTDTGEASNQTGSASAEAPSASASAH